MKKAFAVAWAMAISLAATATQAESTPGPKIDALMRSAAKIGVFNGEILVRQHGKTLYAQSFGRADASGTRPVNSESLFYIGSIEKEFNGSAILLLQQQGKLKLTDKISKYLTGYPAWASEVEIGQLLNYTSGIPVVPDASDDEIHTALLKLQTLPVRPGATYVYSYANVYLQQRIIETIGGTGYHTFLSDRIFRPCGMKGVRTDARLDAPGVALSFYNDFRPVPFKTPEAPGVLFTTEDLSRWMTCLSDGKLLNAASLAALSHSFGTGESSLGSATLVDGRLDSHQHQGSGFNYEALIFSDKTDDLSIVMLTNNQNFKLFPLKDAILAILHDQPYAVPRKSIYLDIREGLAADFQKGVQAYARLRKDGGDVYDFDSEPQDLISAGKFLARRQKYDDAITIFELAATFPLKPPERSYAYELIADAWSRKNAPALAALYYEKALEADPDNKNARSMLATIAN